MTTHPGFLSAIIAEPHNDTPRLIYADWLDENGEAERGEFIRVQCEIAVAPRNNSGHCSYCGVRREMEHREGCRAGRLRKRERELLDSYQFVWLPDALMNIEAQYAADVCTYSRGFVSSLTLTAADFLAHADKITAVCPLERVELTTWPGWHDDFQPLGTIAERLSAMWPHITFTLPPAIEGVSPLTSGVQWIDTTEEMRRHMLFTPGT